jgi:thiamine-monophosphate kinase
LNEQEIIKRLRESFPHSPLGDDAAFLPHHREGLLFTSDAVVEGVHFIREYCTPGQAVQKAITSNVSDIYAMGGKPSEFVFTAGLPEGCTREDLDGIIGGLKLGCRVYGVDLVGGDTVRTGGGFFFDISMLGSVDKKSVIGRGGGQEGDLLVLFGNCGRSLAGLNLLAELWEIKLQGSIIPVVPPEGWKCEEVRDIVRGLSLEWDVGEIGKLCRERNLSQKVCDAITTAAVHIVPVATHPAAEARIEPDYGEVKRPGLITEINAMIDISDGLASDLRALCDESGVGAVIDEESLPVPDSIRGLVPEDRYIECILSSGEEYVQLAAVKSTAGHRIHEGSSVIGVLQGSEEEIVIADRDKNRRKLPRLGFEHRF